ncbi:MAG: hypothetical protein QMC35_01635, partial [Polaribacter sp.]
GIKKAQSIFRLRFLFVFCISIYHPLTATLVITGPSNVRSQKHLLIYSYHIALLWLYVVSIPLPKWFIRLQS